jgi:hypothetical protein
MADSPLLPRKRLGEQALSRRELLKILAATGGAAAASSMLPGKWTHPLVEGGVLPAHAQVSVVIPDTIVKLSWGPPLEVYDLDLRSVGDGAIVDESNTSSPAMSWLYEEIPPTEPVEFTETINIVSADASGQYEIYVHQDPWPGRSEVQQQESAWLTITLGCQVPESRDVAYAILQGGWLHCATIDFDAFAVTWHV